MASARPRISTMVVRAWRLRCAWCGSRHGILRGWFHRHQVCQHCGLSVQRGHQGFELGAATVNTILTLGAIIVAAAVSIAVTYPHVATVPLIVVLGCVAVVLPMLLYPFTYTIWFAAELMMEPPSSQELAKAELALAELAKGPLTRDDVSSETS